MNGFLYGLALQWRLDIRSRTLLVTCYLVPLVFFLLMGGIFTSVVPEMKSTLISSMIVMSVSMGALIGLPPSLLETYGSDVKQMYKANGVPVYLGLVTMAFSAFIHLMLTTEMCIRDRNKWNMPAFASRCEQRYEQWAREKPVECGFHGLFMGLCRKKDTR